MCKIIVGATNEVLKLRARQRMNEANVRTNFLNYVGATNEFLKLSAQRTNVRNQRALRGELKLRLRGERRVPGGERRKFRVV
jgi:hypothetical protein